MTLTRLDKAPMPYYGGKTDAAPTVWAALGDVSHFVDPFCGSLAVLLRRPHLANRPYFSETVNDIDGMLCNAWRAITLRPDETAEAASWPVCEIDLTARHLALVRWQDEHDLERMLADPYWCDPVIAGWWLWGMCCWIGSGWCDGSGPWIVGADGRITKRTNGEPGVSKQRPDLAGDGRGVNHAGTREPGVSRQLPHVSDDGQGVNRPGSRVPGVSKQRPDLAGNGRGVNHAGTREPGVSQKRPHLTDNGQGVNRPGTREPGVWGDDDFHPMTMPELRRWFHFLSARLRHVRMVCGDWMRVMTPSVLKTLPVRQGDGACGIFLDPPYGTSRADGLYAHDDMHVQEAVRAWCLAHGDDPDLRIVLAGFDGEGHETLMAVGWRAVEWFRDGWLKGGMGNRNSNGHQQHRERLYLSPHCLSVDMRPMDALWTDNDDER